MTIGTESERRIHQRVRIYVLAGVLAAAVVVAGATRLGAEWRKDGDTSQTAAVQTYRYQAPELTDEWRWRIRTTRFDHMYRGGR